MSERCHLADDHFPDLTPNWHLLACHQALPTGGVRCSRIYGRYRLTPSWGKKTQATKLNVDLHSVLSGVWPATDRAIPSGRVPQPRDDLDSADTPPRSRYSRNDTTSKMTIIFALDRLANERNADTVETTFPLLPQPCHWVGFPTSALPPSWPTVARRNCK